MTAPSPSSASRPTPGLPWRWLVLLLVVMLAALSAGVMFGPSLRTLAARLAHAGHGHAEAPSSHTHWTCGMHPWVILPQPGDCPICHMALVPLEPSGQAGQVSIDPRITQRIGVRTVSVSRAALTRDIPAVGSVEYDETALADVTLKYAGWVEKLHVNATGQRVRKGDPLLEIYAPSLYVSQEEYLTAVRNHRRAGATAGDSGLLEAARRRLTFLDVTPQQIDELEKRGRSEKTLAVLSPADGVVVQRDVALGSAVESGQLLYRIADLSRVWVQVTVYEQHLPWLKPGMKATMTLPALPGQSFEGTLDYLYPSIDSATRQGKARFVFDNAQGLLMPGMFASVTLHASAGQDALVIPRSAIMDTGKRQVVFVALGQGQFEPREITTGVTSADGLVQVIQGLTGDERVVTSGQFLLDSQANMTLALAQFLSPAAGDGDKPQQGLMPLTQETAGLLNTIIDHYLAMSEQLASGGRDLAKPAQGLAQAARQLASADMPGQPHFWHEHPQAGELPRLAQAVADAGDIAQARLRFRNLSDTLLALLGATGVPQGRDKPVEQLECSMYLEGESDRAGGRWIALVDQVRNPYFGTMMLRCYTGRSALVTVKVVGPDATQPATQPASQPAEGTP